MSNIDHWYVIPGNDVDNVLSKHRYDKKFHYAVARYSLHPVTFLKNMNTWLKNHGDRSLSVSDVEFDKSKTSLRISSSKNSL